MRRAVVILVLAGAALIGSGDETDLAQQVIEIVSGQPPATLDLERAPERR